MALDHADFYEFSDPFEKRALRLMLEEEWVTGKYRNMWVPLLTGEWLPPMPVVFRPRQGCEERDFLWSGSPLFCVSARTVDILLENRLVGWGTYPIEVYDWNDQAISGYHGFAIKGPAVERDLSRSEVISKYSTAGKPMSFYRGFYFDESKWDRSDFFRVDGTKVVTAAVVHALRRARVTNVAFTALPDVETYAGAMNPARFP